jgi:hypothetical protein
MKKIAAIFITMLLSVPAFADFSDSNYFEPTIMCLGVGAGGYFAAPKGNETAYAAGGCIIAAGITYLINKHYENKYSQAYQKRLDRLDETVKQFQELQASKSANGDDGPYSIRIREVVPPQKLSNGEVTAPTIRERLIVPGADMRVGE